MDKQKIRFALENILIAIIATVISLFLSIFLFCMLYYIHEFGHILFGFIDNLLHLKFILPRISVFMECSYFPVPQQTKNISDSLIFAYGGFIFTLMFFYSFAYYLSKAFKKYKYYFYLIASTFLFREFFGNFLFGTDNPIRNPLLNSTNYPILSSISGYILYANIFIISILIISIFKEKFPYKKLKKSLYIP